MYTEPSRIRRQPLPRFRYGLAVCLPLVALLFACQASDDPTGPGANTRPDIPSARPSASEVLAQATPPGMRWFQSHTHAGFSRARATFSPLYVQLAVSISQPTDLGTTFPSNTNSIAVAINSSGQLAGWTAPAEGVQVVKAIRWEANGTPVELPKATEQGQAFASDLNDAGVVVGSDNELHPEFGWSSHAVRWNPDGSMLELAQVPEARGQSPMGINNNGVVVGWAELVNLNIQAVRWDEQGAHPLPGYNHGVAYDVNDAGTAVGYVEAPGMRPAVWSPAGELTVLPLPDGDNFGFAAGINNLGQVVGATGVSNGPDLTHHAVVWAPDGSPTVVPNSEMGQAYKINDAGVIVGYVEDVSPELQGQTGAVWINGERIFAPPSPTGRTVLNDLSDTQLAGGFYSSELHAARWSFVPSSPQFDFTGFFPPVRNPGTSAPYVVNTVKAGQAIPVKFSLNGNQGTNILAEGYPRSKSVACTLADLQGGEVTRSPGKTRLSYSRGADQYSYLWKTEKAWVGTCRQLMVGLTDGSVHTALFRFSK